MNAGQIRSALDAFRWWVDCNVSYPNQGGCGVIAAIVGRELAALGLNVRTRTTSVWHRRPVDEARQRLRARTVMGWRRAGTSCGHLVLEFELDGVVHWYCTQDGLREPHRDRKFSPLMGAFTLDETEHLARYPRGWNRDFDRGQVPLIRDMARKIFQEECHGADRNSAASCATRLPG